MIPNSLIKKQQMIVLILILMILLTIFISLGLGYSTLSYDRIIPILLGRGTFKEHFVLFIVRLPRLIVTLLSGFALALSGAILQSITRNDLADPGIIGINSGAGVGVAIYYLFFPATGTFVYILPIIAFISALLTAIIIYLFSYDQTNGLQPTRLVLTGFGFSMALAGVMVLIFSSVDPFKVDFIAKWLAGNIWGANWSFILALLPWLVILVPIAIYKSNQLNILALGESIAKGVGMSLEKERLNLLLIAVALAASAVSVTGGIAFIGLMAPHIAKSLVGSRSQLYIPVAILFGGWFLILADTIGRNILQPVGAPTGIIVALIGAPYFIFLLLKK